MKLIHKNVATLIGVVAVIGGIFFIALPSCGCTTKHMAAKTATYYNVMEGATAIQLYLVDYDGLFPDVKDQPTFRKVMAPYIKDDQVLADKPKLQVHIDFNIRLANVSAKTLKAPDLVPVLTTPFSESATAPITYYVAGFADGHAKAVPIKDWNAYYADLLDRNYPRVSQTFLPASP